MNEIYRSYVRPMRVLIVLGEDVLLNGTATDDAMAAAMVGAAKFAINIKTLPL